MSWPWNPGQGWHRVIRTDTYRSATYHFLLTFYSNQGPICLSHTVSEIKGDASRKSHIPCILRPRWGGFPWNWVPALGVRKLEWWGYRAEKEVWWYLQPFGCNTPRWRTDGGGDAETDGHRTTVLIVLTHSVVW